MCMNLLRSRPLWWNDLSQDLQPTDAPLISRHLYHQETTLPHAPSAPWTLCSAATHEDDGMTSLPGCRICDAPRHPCLYSTALRRAPYAYFRATGSTTLRLSRRLSLSPPPGQAMSARSNVLLYLKPPHRPTPACRPPYAGMRP